MHSHIKDALDIVDSNKQIISAYISKAENRIKKLETKKGSIAKEVHDKRMANAQRNLSDWSNALNPNLPKTYRKNMLFCAQNLISTEVQN